MDDRHLNHARQQAEDCAFELRILASHENCEGEQEETDEEKRETSTVRFLLFRESRVKTETNTEGRANVAEHD